MKTHDFMIECTGVANTLGRSKGVQVVFEGKGFSTDGKVVQMPSLRLIRSLNRAACLRLTSTFSPPLS